MHRVRRDVAAEAGPVSLLQGLEHVSTADRAAGRPCEVLYSFRYWTSNL